MVRFYLLILFVFFSAAHAAPKPWFIVDPTFDARPGATAYFGEHAKAGYQIEVPDDWNGSLVLWAHGYAGEGPALVVQQPPIRDHLLANGFAWAASSYRSNSYVPGTGAKDTHRLIGLFNGLVGRADRVYISGFSMGGHVTGLAIEQWPQSFVGALPMCGVMGDSELFDYFQDAYLVGESLIGNNPPEVPSPPDYGFNGANAVFLGLSDLPGGLFPGSLNSAGETYKGIIKNLTGGDRPTFEESFVAGPNGALFVLFGVSGTGNGRENLETIYQFDNDPSLSPEEEDFNSLIIRLAADPQYRRRDGLGSLPGSRGNGDSPPINGDISVPVLSMHTIGELFVPFHMQQIYARRVASQGKGDLLVHRSIRDVRHCGFTYLEMTEAFDDLVTWVESGVKAGGDSVLDPVTVSADDYGCSYTQPGPRPPFPGQVLPDLPVCP